MNTLTGPARILAYIRDLQPWAYGHQSKSIATFVVTIIEKQTGNQTKLARTLCNQEATVKRLSRHIRNDRLKARRVAGRAGSYAMRARFVPNIGRHSRTLVTNTLAAEHLRT